MCVRSSQPPVFAVYKSHVLTQMVSSVSDTLVYAISFTARHAAVSKNGHKDIANSRRFASKLNHFPQSDRGRGLKCEGGDPPRCDSDNNIIAISFVFYYRSIPTL